MAPLSERLAALAAHDALMPLQRFLPERFQTSLAIVPVVRLNGVIGISTPFKPGLTLATVARSLDRAFAIRRARAVALIINSPGGSPVQSHLIYRRIRQLADEKKIPVLAFIEDAGASGGYMLACAADEIFCDPSSIIGSIGVMGASFGFEKAIQKLGIERRVYTAGDRKVTLDPFLPEDPRDVAHLKDIQKDIHAGFIALVKERRGTRLTGPESALFSGEYWAGEKAKAFGLVDELGDLRAILRQRFGEKVRTPLIAGRSWFGRAAVGIGLGGRLLSPSATAGLAEELVSTMEERAYWARLGL